jgi:hypothetical protein
MQGRNSFALPVYNQSGTRLDAYLQLNYIVVLLREIWHLGIMFTNENSEVGYHVTKDNHVHLLRAAHFLRTKRPASISYGVL